MSTTATFFQKASRKALPGGSSSGAAFLHRAASCLLLLPALLAGTQASNAATPGPLGPDTAARPSPIPTDPAALRAVPSPLNLVPGQWTWIGGSTDIDAPGEYGGDAVTKSATELQPGGRAGSAAWADAGGNLWLFGGKLIPAGSTEGSYRNDLWKQSIAAGKWTWVNGSKELNVTSRFSPQGVGAAWNAPGARAGSATWIDAGGNLWLLGGRGYGNLDFGLLSDLWKWNTITGQWIWMAGPTGHDQPGTYGTRGVAAPGNRPGAREGAVSWTAAGGDLWLFGGEGLDENGSRGALNDLWKWNVSSGTWTWVAGSKGLGQAGTYGTRGLTAAGNTPGARARASAWSDAAGNLWLFGGTGSGISGVPGGLNDLWRMSLSTGQWTWIGGSNDSFDTGVYGTKGVAAPGNKPGMRESAAAWPDSSGKLWLLGGSGYDTSRSVSILNDLWKFDLASGRWSWESGSSWAHGGSVWGTPGVAAPSNVPSARERASTWTDGSGNLWLFGGRGDGANGTGDLSDLWVYANPVPRGSATCVPDDTNVCLLGGRFQVSAEWADYGGTRGTGKAVYLTPDTGYFWFSSASNVEVVAKLVSFCGDGASNVSVYAAGLTDLDVTLHVTDTRTGVSRTYRNPLGTPFSLIRDGAFGCPAAVTPPAERSVATAPGRIVEATSWTPLAYTPCTSDSTTLCLIDGRFQVRSTYRGYGGQTGYGKAVVLTPDTGTFWFLDQSNVEVIAKMVRFCGNGSDNVAIYAGGLTDLEVTLTVVDTLSGFTKSYTNTLGAPFQLIRDGPFTCR